MGGGEGSTARESLKHKDVEKSMIVDFCREHLTENQEAFHDDKLHIVFNDAKDELEKTEEKFDVIVGDLPDPIEGGPWNDLYTKPFYEQVIKPHLKDNGIFVTQASDEPLKLNIEQLNSRIQERIRGDLLYLDGASIVSSTVVNKMIYTLLLKETQVLTGENVRFVYGHGLTKNAEE
ncbi:thermospermine synthase ACAULIS5-like [Prunus yedoensis var. nudiflora]|uniref:Thermospermine synthase ACAULIS5-like n=1 Tax=Prunus yedoensis var. nudiflora TaxID=2094558 RepID=A0A314YM35_PRUYE|nr:thermospermine synthase ACAULIS5-like [Prunus yedoensis var. nudiflora]